QVVPLLAAVAPLANVPVAGGRVLLQRKEGTLHRLVAEDIAVLGAECVEHAAGVEENAPLLGHADHRPAEFGPPAHDPARLDGRAGDGAEARKDSRQYVLEARQFLRPDARAAVAATVPFTAPPEGAVEGRGRGVGDGQRKAGCR